MGEVPKKLYIPSPKALILTTNQPNVILIPFIKRSFVIGWCKTLMDHSLGVVMGGLPIKG